MTVCACIRVGVCRDDVHNESGSTDVGVTDDCINEHADVNRCISWVSVPD